MKKDLVFFILFSILISAPLSVAYADVPQGLIDMLDRLVSIVYTIFGTVAVVCYIYAGVMFATASGDSEKLKTAKQALMWAVIGTILGVISASIVPILESGLGQKAVTPPPPPEGARSIFLSFFK